MLRRAFLSLLVKNSYITAIVQRTGGKLCLPAATNITNNQFVQCRTAHGSSFPDMENEAEFNNYFIQKFNRQDIDGWDLRQTMNNLIGMDCVPDPTVIQAALHACRRVDDIALAIRWLEACKDKCGSQEETIYPYLMEQIRPTLCELGIPTLEQLGYHCPELALKSVFDM